WPDLRRSDSAGSPFTPDRHFVDFEIGQRSANTPKVTVRSDRIAQIDHSIDHSPDRKEHHDHRDETNRVAIHLRDATVDTIHRVSVKRWLLLQPWPRSPIALTACRHPSPVYRRHNRGRRRQ